MAEQNYVQDTWSDLEHFTCIVPVGAWVGAHGWDCMTLEAMTSHLWDAHGLEPVGEGEE